VRLKELRGVVDSLSSLGLAVSLWVVVVRVDHDLARQGLDRDLPVVLSGTVTTTMSPSLAASTAAARRAFGPSSTTSADRVSGHASCRSQPCSRVPRKSPRFWLPI